MADNSKVSTLTKNTSWVYIGKLGTQLLTFLTTILVIRKLDVDVYGTYGLLLKVMVLFNVFSVSPIGSVFNRYIPELIEGHGKNKLKKLLGLGIFLIIISTIILGGLLHIFDIQFADFLNIPSFNNYKTMLFTYILAMVLRLVSTSILTSALLHKQSSSFLLFSTFIRSVLLIILLPKINVNVLLLVDSIVAFLYFCPSMVAIYKFIRKTMTSKATELSENVSRKRVITYGLYSSLNELGVGIVGRTSDYFIISAMSNVQNVGFYSFANKIYELIYKLLPFKEFLTVVRPLFFQKFSSNFNQKEFDQIFSFMIKATIPVFFIPVFYFIVFGKLIIFHVFDPKYMEAYVVCVLVLLTNVYLPFFYPVGLVMQLKERMEIGLQSKIVVVFSIFAGIFAMKFYGIVGVALASLIGDLTKHLLILVLLKRKVNIHYKIKDVSKFLMLFIFVNVAFFFAMINAESIKWLLIGSAIYLPIIGLIVIKAHPFGEMDMPILNKIGTSNSKTKKLSKLIQKIYNLGPRIK